MHEWLENVLNEQYQFVTCLRKTEKSEIVVLEHKTLHTRVIKRTFSGNAEVYKALLNHKIENIPQIIDVIEEHDKITVFEEYIDGVTLYELLQEELYNEKSVKKLISELCDVLSILHGHNIIHRDIKPENIMIDKIQTVKLIDFDSARIYKPYYPKDTEYLGTAGYAAPEQYGDTQTDSRTDIYAVGILMNVLLTGKTPSVQLYNGGLGNVIEKCIQVNPDKRYQSAEELKKALTVRKKKKHLLIIPFVVIIPVVIGFVIILPNLKHYSVVQEESEKTASHSEIESTPETTTAHSETEINTTTATSQTEVKTITETTFSAETNTTTTSAENEDYYYVGNYMTEGKSYGQIHNYGGYEECGGTVLEIAAISPDSITFSITAYGYGMDSEHNVNFSERNVTANIENSMASYQINLFEFEDTNENVVGTFTFESGKIHHLITRDNAIILDEYLIFDDFGV